MLSSVKGLSKIGAPVGVVEVGGLARAEEVEEWGMVECGSLGRIEPRRDSAGDEEAEEAGRRGSPVAFGRSARVSSARLGEEEERERGGSKRTHPDYS